MGHVAAAPVQWARLIDPRDAIPEIQSTAPSSVHSTAPSSVHSTAPSPVHSIAPTSARPVKRLRFTGLYSTGIGGLLGMLKKAAPRSRVVSPPAPLPQSAVPMSPPTRRPPDLPSTSNLDLENKQSDPVKSYDNLLYSLAPPAVPPMASRACCHDGPCPYHSTYEGESCNKYETVVQAPLRLGGPPGPAVDPTAVSGWRAHVKPHTMSCMKACLMPDG